MLIFLIKEKKKGMAVIHPMGGGDPEAALEFGWG
jgi:hypothetical protein